MKFTQLFTKTRKDIAKTDSVNANYLVRGGFIDQLSAGTYTFLPLGWRVYKKIEAIIKDEMEKAGGQEIFMPAMHPKANWEKTGRLEGLDIIYRVIGNLSGDENLLGPTHEEVVTPLAAKFIFSYKDLPKYVYQIQDKFRDEARPKSGLLRTKEFMMKDLYSFHTDSKDLDRYYKVMEKSYFNIFERCGIGKDTVLTYSSGGSFSKYSHEFQLICDTGEDTVYLCEKCNVAVNKEIYHEQNSCPECNNTKLVPRKGIEVGNIFKLMDKFSISFGFNYIDQHNKKNPVLMGCYGIGLGRLLASVVEVSHDESGIIWPESITPYDVHLISLNQTEEEAQNIYDSLIKAGYDVLWDDRDERAGVKLADSDLIGIPHRIVISPKTLNENKLEYKSRTQKDSKLITLKDFLKGR